MTLGHLLAILETPPGELFQEAFVLLYFTSHPAWKKHFDYPSAIVKIQLQYLTRPLKPCNIEMYYTVEKYLNAEYEMSS